MMRLIVLLVAGILSVFAQANQDNTDTKQWDRPLPFHAQAAIDTGVDLPFPFGVGVIYTRMDQKFLLDDLDVSINDSKVIEADFVTFGTLDAYNDTMQVKVDAYVFPFLNIFAAAGIITGNSPVEVTIDGDGMLDYLGADCSKVPQPLECRLLEGKEVSFVADARVDGYNFTTGFTVSTMVNKIFVSAPFAYTWSKIERSTTTRTSILVSPRAGYLLSLGSYGKAALFAGGSYMNIDLYSEGVYYFGDTKLEYRIHQKNKDKWNMLTGYNWFITDEVSWNFEAGFLGSRSSIISGLTYRF